MRGQKRRKKSKKIAAFPPPPFPLFFSEGGRKGLAKIYTPLSFLLQPSCPNSFNASSHYVKIIPLKARERDTTSNEIKSLKKWFSNNFALIELLGA